MAPPIWAGAITEAGCVYDMYEKVDSDAEGGRVMTRLPLACRLGGRAYTVSVYASRQNTRGAWDGRIGRGG